ncbi:MAG: 4-(cytidine 5'-diphospho)-2-C-methyl-D-erythritol kinase [Bacteroidetes bacterium]|nr:4-(cytidine 5'-diphospho)-2-C-methyl-D-erythritol kinase [Bacteroidota bacterium]
MIVFPNAKINLGLHITGRRPDGFHDLETVFYPVPVKDALEIVHAPAAISPETDISLTVYGLTVSGQPEDNLCVKAFRLLKTAFPSLPALSAHLLKNIPMGAGLGGGSADGAFMLRLLNEKFHLGMDTTALLGYAAQLGSDCPFFVHNQPCYATGRGEILSPVSLSLAGWQLVLVSPGIHVNTGWAFGQLDRASFGKPRAGLVSLLQEPVPQWKDRLVNDFEAPVFAAHPLLQSIRDELYARGAAYAAMSGSGSTVFGLFEAAERQFDTRFTELPDGAVRVMNL